MSPSSCAAPTAAASSSAAASGPATRRTRTARVSRRVPARGRPARVALRRRRRRRSRSACFCRTCRTRSHVIVRADVTAPTDVELALRPSVNFRAQEAPVSEPLGWPYDSARSGDRYEIALRGSRCRRCADAAVGAGRDVHAEGQAASTTCSIRSKRAAATRRAATSGARLLPCPLRRGQRPRWSPPPNRRRR